MMRNYAATFAFVTFRVGLMFGGTHSPLPLIGILINMMVIELKIQSDNRGWCQTSKRSSSESSNWIFWLISTDFPNGKILVVCDCRSIVLCVNYWILSSLLHMVYFVCYIFRSRLDSHFCFVLSHFITLSILLPFFTLSLQSQCRLFHFLNPFFSRRFLNWKSEKKQNTLTHLLNSQCRDVRTETYRVRLEVKGTPLGTVTSWAHARGTCVTMLGFFSQSSCFIFPF